MAGADVVQVVSVLYKNGIREISTILENLSAWMKSKGYESISDFKGKLSKNNLKEPYAYERAQYVDYLMKKKKILKEYSV